MDLTVETVCLICLAGMTHVVDMAAGMDADADTNMTRDLIAIGILTGTPFVVFLYLVYQKRASNQETRKNVVKSHHALVSSIGTIAGLAAVHAKRISPRQAHQPRAQIQSLGEHAGGHPLAALVRRNLGESPYK
jgi:hypothetical protein